MRRYDGSNSWFLIDFMDAKLSPADASSGEHLSRKSHAPEIFDASCKHTTAVDIWSVGYLIETSDVQWFDAGKRSAFKNELMHPDPTKRPTAMDAIRRLMELKKEYLQDEDSEYSEEEEKGLEDEDSAEEEDMQEENMPSEKCGVGEGDIPPSNKKQRIE
ncbi:hypothetical protein PF005_g8768 [Phytophthora fragariae]|uniref:Protein kinase domain-containing protein n=2 Tax=Phytophthora fragariae TaxID=53985 RepID=A0A6A3L618_9STRA|nr:hypothetical protein PF003_g4067 [Phytophthora fragariae]KAE8941847.1 hypothetical protein PF009_g8369 [Phytophthora fragariae]KAE9015032.1 hypothetical protein PF011_g7789 [Phytophthora fragariae]KAE9118492.1 hypothetical protein PF007_g8900 [Phytophthora fragariae]KAE9148729.1 hypothetical protein PF006_g6720 [Phytophthora fragariae]